MEDDCEPPFETEPSEDFGEEPAEDFAPEALPPLPLWDFVPEEPFDEVELLVDLESPVDPFDDVPLDESFAGEEPDAGVDGFEVEPVGRGLAADGAGAVTGGAAGVRSSSVFWAGGATTTGGAGGATTTGGGGGGIGEPTMMTQPPAGLYPAPA